MQVILLAAGRGLRLDLATADTPKTLLTVGDKPLLAHILASIQEFDLESIHVVGGFQFAKLAAYVNEIDPKIHVYENKNFLKGNLLTALVAKKPTTGLFCLMNADHLYSNIILNKILTAKPNQITAVCDFDRALTDDDMKVELSNYKYIKLMKKKLSNYQAGYVGVTLIPDHKRELYWEVANQVLSKQGEGACVEEVVNELVKGGEQVDILDISGSTWLEVDTAEDRLRAKSVIDKMNR